MFFFFFNDTATTEIYTLSLHDALPISLRLGQGGDQGARQRRLGQGRPGAARGEGQADPDRRVHRFGDRKSTRLNSSHLVISYAVFCLKKKKKIRKRDRFASRMNSIPML